MPDNTSVSTKPCPIRYQDSNATTPIEHNSNNLTLTANNLTDDPHNAYTGILSNAARNQNTALDTTGEMPGFLLTDLEPMDRREIDIKTDNWFVLSSLFNSLTPQSVLYTCRVRVPAVHNQVIPGANRITFTSTTERDEWISLHTFCIVEDPSLFNEANSRVAGTNCKIKFQDPNGQYAIITDLAEASPNPLPEIINETATESFETQEVQTLAELQAQQYTDYLEEECATDGAVAGTDAKPIGDLYHSMDDFFPVQAVLPIEINYEVTSPTCPRNLNDGNFHSGFDLNTPIGTPLKSTAPGIVQLVRRDSPTAGNYVSIYHQRPNDSGKEIYTRYLHMDTISVTQNQSVQAGQSIGTTGNTGLSSGPHLHYEIRVGGQAGFDGVIIPAFRTDDEPMITAAFI